MNKQQLIERIKTHIAKSDQYKDKSDQYSDKSDQHAISAGQCLKTLKAEHADTWAEWETLLKTKIGISTGRASELMQVADGRKTVEKLAPIRPRACGKPGRGLLHYVVKKPPPSSKPSRRRRTIRLPWLKI
jgi:hypothetical protein